MEQKYHFFLTLPSPRSKTQRLPALFHPLPGVFRCPCGRGRRASLSFGWRFSAFGLCFPREGRRGGTDRLPPRLRAECRPHLWVGSRRFPLLCSFRPFARGRLFPPEETFVPSRRDEIYPREKCHRNSPVERRDIPRVRGEALPPSAMPVPLPRGHKQTSALSRGG